MKMEKGSHLEETLILESSPISMSITNALKRSLKAKILGFPFIIFTFSLAPLLSDYETNNAL